VTPSGRPAVFLDRDGTLIEDQGYPRCPALVRLLPGVAEALRLLRRHGFLLVVVSNQSGVGRGLITVEQAQSVHQEVVRQLAQSQVALDASYYCFHAPWSQCPCRKPSPGLILRAAEDLRVDLRRSFMVGDRASDVEAGRRAGCGTVLLSRPGSPSAPGEPDRVASGWMELVKHILGLAQGEQ
jgi:histidinol-phosphate phosphatase family protein